jgi:hypothetical protein
MDVKQESAAWTGQIYLWSVGGLVVGTAIALSLSLSLSLSHTHTHTHTHTLKDSMHTCNLTLSLS